MSFTHLHTHSDYSLLDSLIKIKDLIQRTKELGMDSIALTDHGNLFGALEFYQQAKKENLKPIVGMEAYVAHQSRFDRKSVKDDRSRRYYHLILLCKNQTGYKNLIKLASLAYEEGFYYKPQIDKELLSQNSEGLIALSACLKGQVPGLLATEDYAKAKYAAEEHLAIFGRDHYFLELQDHGIGDQEVVNKGLIRISSELDIPLVATNDSHYLHQNDAKAHEVLLCIGGQKKLSEEHMTYYGDQFYLKSEEEMRALFSYAQEAVDNTHVISDACQFEFEFGARHLPQVDIPKDFTDQSYLEHLSKQKISHFFPDGYIYATHTEIEDRLAFELSVIEQMQLAPYFLCVIEIVTWSKNQGIMVGPGRGSAPACLVSYLTGITAIDPIRWNLPFERFLNPDRRELPDIDTDFPNDRRQEVIDFVRKKYGEDRVATIITFGSMNARGVIRDVGRVLDIPIYEVDAIAKAIPAHTNLLESMKTEEPLQKLIQSRAQYQDLWQFALKLEGVHRHASTHAAGVLIGNRPLKELVPLYTETKNKGETKIQSSQYEGGHLEKVGLVKMDLLGLKNLTVIVNCLKLIKQYRSVEIDIDQIPLDDAPTYDLLKQGRSQGIFQLESHGMQELMKALQPDRFEEIIALIALYRPGVLKSKTHLDYVDRKHGRKKIVYPNACLEPILKDTYGIIVYQEQVMFIAQEYAGFTRGEADFLRKAMGKKIDEVMQKWKVKFLEGAALRNYDQSEAEKLFEQMAVFSGYGFNKPHAAAYAYISYRTAYLKANYTIEFMTALMTNELGSTDNQILLYMNECKDMGIQVATPDINSSMLNFSIENPAPILKEPPSQSPSPLTAKASPPAPIQPFIRFGLLGIKHVGEKAINGLVEERVCHGKFRDLYDLCSRVDKHMISSRMLEYLIYAGALDTCGYSRRSMIESIPDAIRMGQKSQEDRQSSQLSLFGGADQAETLRKPEVVKLPEYEPLELLQREKEALGFCVSEHPMEQHKKTWMSKGIRFTDFSGLERLEQEDSVLLFGLLESIEVKKSKNGKEVRHLTLSDPNVTLLAFLYEESYRTHQSLIREHDFYIFYGKIWDIRNRRITIHEIFSGHADTIDRNTLSKVQKLGASLKKSPTKKGGLKPMNSNQATRETVPSSTMSTSSQRAYDKNSGFHIQLYGEMNSTVEPLKQIREIILKHSGGDAVYFHVNGSNNVRQTIRAGEKYRVDSADPTLMAQLKEIKSIIDVYRD